AVITRFPCVPRSTRRLAPHFTRHLAPRFTRHGKARPSASRSRTVRSTRLSYTPITWVLHRVSAARADPVESAAKALGRVLDDLLGRLRARPGAFLRIFNRLCPLATKHAAIPRLS